MAHWLVIGISGVTCGGKTSLTVLLKSLLTKHYLARKGVAVSSISQDDYFLKEDDPRHVCLTSLGHNNWELPTAVDLDAMYKTAQDIICDKNERKCTEADRSVKNQLKGILLIEGFLVLNHKPTRSLCHLGYYLVLSRAVCQSRRSHRSYDPPDVPGYFERCVWPEHVHRRIEILGRGKLVDYSDPLSISELSQCSKKGDSKADQVAEELIQEKLDVNFINTENRFDSQGKKDTLEDVNSAGDCGDLWMRMGGDVLPLEGFGKAGLGMVNGVRVLNGGTLNEEELAQLVFEDVLKEIQRLKFD